MSSVFSRVAQKNNEETVGDLFLCSLYFKKGINDSFSEDKNHPHATTHVSIYSTIARHN